MLIYTQSLIRHATRPHYLLNFGSEKIGPRTIKLAFITQRQNVTKVALFVHPISFGSRLLNAKKYVNPSAFKCRKRVHVRTLRYAGLAFNAEKVQITRKKRKLVSDWPL